MRTDLILSGEEDLNLTMNGTTGIFSKVNSTTVRPYVPQTPPPIGYYGDTRELLWKVLTPVIITWGTFGNLLTIIVLMRQAKKMSSTAMYLLALALSDLLLLWCAPFRNWMKYMWDIDVRYLNDVTCRVQLYLTYGCMHFSSFLLVAVTMERTVGVVSPHTVKLHCTPKRAGVVIASIFIFVFGIDLVIPIITALDGYQPLRGQDPVKCAPSTKEYTQFRDDIWQWIDLSLTFLVPFAFLVIGNTLIIGYLHKSRRNQRVMRVSRGKERKKTSRNTWSLTILMIALCVIFFVTMTPVSVFQIYYPYRYEEIQEMFFQDPLKAWESYQYLLLQHTIVNLISYTNASFNFVLYVFSGTRFRAELKMLLCCSSARQLQMFSSVTATSNLKNKSTKNSNLASSYKIGDKIDGGGKLGDVIGVIGKDNLVFVDDSALSSISSIFATRKADDTALDESECENNENKDSVLEYPVTVFTTCLQNIEIDRTELNGFYLQM